MVIARESICVLCKRKRGDHSAKKLRCPIGQRTQIGYIGFHPENVFTPKESKKS